MEERLRNILSSVSEHLKFAETKNATLFAANAATIFGCLQILAGLKDKEWISRYFIVLVAFSTFSALIILISFLPQTKIPWLFRGRPVRSKDSLLFFGDIQRYDPRSYLLALYESCEIVDPKPARIELMYAEQIIVNAKIASRKYTYFRYAIWITLAGILTPLLAIPLHRLFHTSHNE
jgi:hypothetical protein